MTQGRNEILPYMSNSPAKMSRMALTSMILGILGVVTSCVGIGVLLGLVGLILGIISLIKINHHPATLAGKGFAITGIATGAVSFVGVALMVAIMMPRLGQAREWANRSACGANQTGIMKACITYANENSDAFPLLNGNGSGATTSFTLDSGQATSTPPSSDPESALYAEYFSGSSGGKGGTPTAGVTQVDRTLWILVLKNQITPRMLLCRSDPYADKTGSPATNSAGDYYVCPAPGGLSYSIAFPWDRAGPGAAPYWNNMTDSSMPLLSDMAKYGSSFSLGSPTKNYNSPNHGFEGQNVGFGDAHVEWMRAVDVGQQNDNIFTYGTTRGGTEVRAEPVDLRSAPLPPFITSAPAAAFGSSGPYDVIMVPSRDGAAAWTQ